MVVILLRLPFYNDPLGLTTLMTGSDNYFHACPYINTFQNRAKQNKVQLRIIIATGGFVSLAERIIDDPFLYIPFSLHRKKTSGQGKGFLFSRQCAQIGFQS